MNGRTPSTSEYPADYTLQLLACLQGITHTFLLPFGQSKFNLLHGMTLGAAAFVCNWSPPSTRHSPTHRRKSSGNLSSHLKGEPLSIYLARVDSINESELSLFLDRLELRILVTLSAVNF